MKKLIYYLNDRNGKYRPLYEYKVTEVGIDELYARQLCTYFIMRGNQYELVSNEMDGEEEILVVTEIGRNVTTADEFSYRGKGLNIEVRRFRESENYKRLTTIPCQTHFDIIRFLLKDIVDIPGIGQMAVTSTEIDEDRGVYVIYVKDIMEAED
ncbi:RNA helicase [Neobacillus terrae]|uniref:RNA helicase n=1 Tax=Neobacillus terrae TaxID=3034837 RepID=UPI0014072916|nr:RNA helicase [Neobacillus terrae]NHM32531.1 RNA helicase [Neobacillus terrae]